ncbi:hypothetical protein [Rhizobium sp. NZLR1]|uniref:hypothetical protein n=1 Tax=Rhizobium sp. NZLR1 TaxID=2731096 RepID=UPI001A99DD59|nr:hypothetical protein [Rhizobium sp. NZLR1]MBX5201028.1 hypothetical protein [Rhizobium sp. NZLR1]QSZ21541.1 hypothetical protein J3O30_02940 [Rhizobium sp. NZLR1]
MSDKQKIIDAYKSMIQERIDEGFEGSLLTFMFKELKGSEETRKARMEDEVERIYATLLTRFLKDQSKVPIDNWPFFLGCVDWPVHKKIKKALHGIANNDGMHLGGIYLVPPKTRTAMNLEDIVDRARPQIMRSGMLTNVHVKPIKDTPTKATGYVLKSFDKLRIGSDGIFILPRHPSEMSKKGA